MNFSYSSSDTRLFSNVKKNYFKVILSTIAALAEKHLKICKELLFKKGTAVVKVCFCFRSFTDLV